jgi:hypothetical protein
MNDEVRLAICLPLVGDHIDKRFFVSWVIMDKPAEYNLILPTLHPGEFYDNIAAVRNHLAEQALINKCTHILMMDTDQIYPPDTVTKLIAHNLPIVGAKVHRRYAPFDPLLLRGSLGKYHRIPDEEWEACDGLIEVDATGTGCTMFQSEVFRKLEFPWFKIIPGRGKRKSVGEDVYMFSKAKKAGYRIFVDTSIEIGHLTMLEINRHFSKLYRLAKINQPI